MPPGSPSGETLYLTHKHVAAPRVLLLRPAQADEPAMNEFDEAAYNMAAVTATVALYRALVKKGLMPREEARQILLDAISRSIEAEALRQEPGVSKITMEINDQSVEILKFIAEHL
jgi:hypothetical protein